MKIIKNKMSTKLVKCYICKKTVPVKDTACIDGIHACLKHPGVKEENDRIDKQIAEGKYPGFETIIIKEK